MPASLLFYLLLSVTQVLFDHGIYISVIEVHVGEDRAKITVKVFTDDLVDVLKNYNHENLSTMDVLDEEELSEYFNSKLEFLFDGRKRHLQLMGYQLKGESVFIEFEVDKLLEDSKIEIEASFFFELFPAQNNILRLKSGDQQEFRIFKSKTQKELLCLTH